MKTEEEKMIKVIRSLPLEKTYNGTGLLVGCVAWLIALVCLFFLFAGFLWIIF